MTSIDTEQADISNLLLQESYAQVFKTFSKEEQNALYKYFNYIAKQRYQESESKSDSDSEIIAQERE